MKTPTNQVHQNRNAARTSPQVKTKTPAAPGEFKIIRLRDCPVDSPIIYTPPEVVDFWRKHVVTAQWFKDDKECLCVFMLNVHHRLLGFELVSQGTGDMVLMHPREVLRPAAVHNAAAIIIAHNHPSGEPSPSEGDIKATRDLIRAAEHLKIELLDHVVIGDPRREKSYASLRELDISWTAIQRRFPRRLPPLLPFHQSLPLMFRTAWIACGARARPPFHFA